MDYYECHYESRLGSTTSELKNGLRAIQIRTTSRSWQTRDPKMDHDQCHYQGWAQQPVKRRMALGILTETIQRGGLKT